MSYKTVHPVFDGSVCFIQFTRPNEGNTITECFIAELHSVLDECDAAVTAVVLKGSETAFCLGMDFQEIQQRLVQGRSAETVEPERLYELWERLSSGPYITISHVQGRVNAGGIGFVAASDIVIAAPGSEFSLSELLFGLLPACVLPFLIRRVGHQKANYLALSTLSIAAEEAKDWGLVDVCNARSDVILRKQLSRIRRLSKESIVLQKNYSAALCSFVNDSKAMAFEINRDVFSNPKNLAAIKRYVEEEKFPWEA